MYDKYYSAINGKKSFHMTTWMNHGGMTLSEISKRKTGRADTWTRDLNCSGPLICKLFLIHTWSTVNVSSLFYHILNKFFP